MIASKCVRRGGQTPESLSRGAGKHAEDLEPKRMRSNKGLGYRTSTHLRSRCYARLPEKGPLLHARRTFSAPRNSSHCNVHRAGLPKTSFTAGGPITTTPQKKEEGRVADAERKNATHLHNALVNQERYRYVIITVCRPCKLRGARKSSRKRAISNGA